LLGAYPVCFPATKSDGTVDRFSITSSSVLCYPYHIFLWDLAAMDSDDRALRRLKLSDLRLLDAVVQRGGMAKAAAHLNISQPAVSKAIAALERVLDVRLLDRTPHGVEPTIYGQALLKGGVAVFDELRQRVNEIQFLADPTAGEVQVGINSSQVAGLAPTIIDRLMSRYPRIVVNVVEADTFTLLNRDLRARNIDLVLGSVPIVFAEEGLDIQVLCEEHLYVVAGMRSPWAHRRKTELRLLVNEPWVLPPYNSFVGSLVAEAFRGSCVDVPQARVVTQSILLVSSLLATRPFLAMLPGSLLRYSSRRLSLKVLPIDLPKQPRSIAIVTLKNRTLSPVAQLFIDCARTVATPRAG
jgi:DNA-binding transcriptional LysR family regulator